MVGSSEFQNRCSDAGVAGLLSVLQRSGYPFGVEGYEKQGSLERLHKVIEEILKPLEPTFPPGVPGLCAG